MPQLVILMDRLPACSRMAARMLAILPLFPLLLVEGWGMNAPTHEKKHYGLRVIHALGFAVFSQYHPSVGSEPPQAVPWIDRHGLRHAIAVLPRLSSRRRCVARKLELCVQNPFLILFCWLAFSLPGSPNDGDPASARLRARLHFAPGIRCLPFGCCQ